MRFRWAGLAVLAVMAATAGFAQDAPPRSQDPAQNAGPGMGRGRGWGTGIGGRGVVGVVTEVAPDHYAVKNDSGEIYTIHYSANTRIMEAPNLHGATTEMNVPPEAIKPGDIKVGDAILARGEVDATAKSVGAIVVVKIDPERARMLREMEANFGKTWLAGRVTKVEDTKVTIQSAVDNAEHTFVADENTSFRRRRELVTMADIEVGSNLRVEGSVKQGVFVAATVNVMGPQAQGGPAHRTGPPPQ